MNQPRQPLKPPVLATLARLTATAVLTLGTALAQAAPLQNGSFDTGLTAWSTAGDVAAQGASLLLSTATTFDQDDAPELAGAFNLSGQNPTLAGNDLEANLGLAPGALDQPTLDRFAYEGSAAWQSFSVQAGDTLAFDWQLLTRPTLGPIELPDTAWLVWQQGAQTQLIKLADTLSVPLSNSTNGWLASGVEHHNVLAQASGQVKLGFVIADVNSFDTTSLLSIQHVVQTSAVPEPGTVMLVLAGLAMMLFMQRRQERQHRD